MSKFKVGDRVRRVGSTMPWAPYGYECAVVGIGPSGSVVYIGRDGKESSCEPADLELVSPAVSPSPVRTKTVKEIVPGKYGVVEVRTSAPDIHIPDNRLWTPATLREAARIFNELADALEA